MADTFLAGNGLYTALTGSSGLITEIGGTKIWEGLAPQGTSLPYLIFQWQGGGDENITPSEMVNEVWTVKAVAATLAKAKAIAALAHTALHGQTLTVTGWTNFLTRGEDTVRYQEVDPNGNAIHHIGRIYRIRLGA